jgi:hypothetical protein
MMKEQMRKKWLRALGEPSFSQPCGEAVLIDRFSHTEFDAELYRQQNGEGKYQRVMLVFPKELKAPAPAVAVPFYFPEAMLGFDPNVGEILETYRGVEMMLHLVRRGYIAASADAYHLTYIESDKDRGDFSRWQDAADALRHDHPHWSGVGKLFFDTELMLDLLCADARVDSSRVGIAGHSLGGKMAFYTGCLDERVKAILASDFGIGWDQTNWNDTWYWGADAEKLKNAGFEHSELLSIAQKPFCLIAGHYDNDESLEIMLRAEGYTENDERLKFINHATGHRPPMWTLDEGYDFLDKWVKG